MTLFILIFSGGLCVDILCSHDFQAGQVKWEKNLFSHNILVALEFEGLIFSFMFLSLKRVLLYSTLMFFFC